MDKISLKQFEIFWGFLFFLQSQARFIFVEFKTVYLFTGKTMMILHKIKWAKTRQNLSSGVTVQARHKPAYAATEAR